MKLTEEHGETEVSKVYQRADELLKGTQDAEDKERLRTCARVVIKRPSGMQSPC